MLFISIHKAGLSHSWWLPTMWIVKFIIAILPDVRDQQAKFMAMLLQTSLQKAWLSSIVYKKSQKKQKQKNNNRQNNALKKLQLLLSEAWLQIELSICSHDSATKKQKTRGPRRLGALLDSCSWDDIGNFQQTRIKNSLLQTKSIEIWANSHTVRHYKCITFRS